MWALWREAAKAQIGSPSGRGPGFSDRDTLFLIAPGFKNIAFHHHHAGCQRATCPPAVQLCGVAVADGLLAGKCGINGIERQDDLDMASFCKNGPVWKDLLERG
ncbi:MAG TPA: hypothetical protein PKV33_07920 [Methanothrix sp.]|nr:hypothetical protein [Methanothrix sp.]